MSCALINQRKGNWAVARTRGRTAVTCSSLPPTELASSAVVFNYARGGGESRQLRASPIVGIPEQPAHQRATLGGVGVAAASERASQLGGCWGGVSEPTDDSSPSPAHHATDDTCKQHRDTLNFSSKTFLRGVTTPERESLGEISDAW